MRKNLALNRHWYDALLDYSPTALIIDFDYPSRRRGDYPSRRRDNDDKAIVDKLVQSLKQVNLSKLKLFKFRNKIKEVMLHKECFDVLFFTDKYYDNSDFDKGHFGHFLIGNPHFPVYVSKDSPFSTKKNYQSLFISNGANDIQS